MEDIPQSQPSNYPYSSSPPVTNYSNSVKETYPTSKKPVERDKFTDEDGNEIGPVGLLYKVLMLSQERESVELKQKPSFWSSFLNGIQKFFLRY